MKLAMQIPLAHLKELSPYCDFDFCLAHMLLKGGHTTYTKFYRRQVEDGREVWLDNSFHELGKSLGMEELTRAYKMICPTHLVAEETFNDPVKTFHQISQMLLQRSNMGWDCQIVGTWQGYKKDLARLHDVCDVVALPFRRPRQRVVNNITSRRYHYFGFRTIDEIRRLPPMSLDTSAPIKYALHGQDINTRERRLNTPPLEYGKRLTDKQLEEVVRNINCLKQAAD